MGKTPTSPLLPHGASAHLWFGNQALRAEGLWATLVVAPGSVVEEWRGLPRRLHSLRDNLLPRGSHWSRDKEVPLPSAQHQDIGLLLSPGERQDYRIRGRRPTCLLVQSVMRAIILPTQTWKTSWGEYCLVRVAFLLLYRMKNSLSFCWIAGWIKYTSFCLPKDHLFTICKGTWLPLRNVSVELQYSTHWGVQKSERKTKKEVMDL